MFTGKKLFFKVQLNQLSYDFGTFFLWITESNETEEIKSISSKKNECPNSQTSIHGWILYKPD